MENQLKHSVFLILKKFYMCPVFTLISLLIFAVWIILILVKNPFDQWSELYTYTLGWTDFTKKKNKTYFFLIDLEKANLHQKAKREQKWGPYFTSSIETLYDNSARQSKEKTELENRWMKGPPFEPHSLSFFKSCRKVWKSGRGQ